MVNDDDAPAHFADLPKATRAFLRHLREEDIEELVEAVELVRFLKRFGRFGKWFLLSVLGAFLGAVSLGEAVGKVIAWWQGK